jgi:hypothetical protein
LDLKKDHIEEKLIKCKKKMEENEISLLFNQTLASKIGHLARKTGASDITYSVQTIL